jgi:hypothetical protein
MRSNLFTKAIAMALILLASFTEDIPMPLILLASFASAIAISDMRGS